MKAIAVTPGQKHSAKLVDAPTPSPAAGQARVKVLRGGICGTDVEIDSGEYGLAPSGESYLIIGHENLGVVESLGAGAGKVKPGDLVVSTVRRPDDCPQCRAGEQDMCTKGDYTERGIKGRHGFLAEYYVEAPENLVVLPPSLKNVGVLLEPTTVVEKGIRHAWSLQRRMKAWEPKKALVLGAGPVGLLASMVLRLRGLEVVVYGRDASESLAARIGEMGASYVSALDAQGRSAAPLASLPGSYGPFDFVFEATGAASVAMGAMQVVGVDGVVCLASVTGGDAEIEVDAPKLNLSLVLGNRVVFGTVNANHVDFEQGVRDLEAAHQKWPGWLDKLITRHVPAERFRDAFTRQPGDIKVVVEFG